MEIFGFEITRKKDELSATEVKCFRLFHLSTMTEHQSYRHKHAGFITGGAYGSYIDMEGGIKNEQNSFEDIVKCR